MAVEALQNVCIPLTNGGEAQIDPGDVEKVSAFCWYGVIRNGVRYARIAASGKAVYLHHLILPAVRGMTVDHKNGDGLDNRRSNLRYATHSQNSRNAKKRDNLSGYKGVSWHDKANRWHARIWTGEKSRHLGLFDFPEDAADAYDTAARELYGEFARVNFPQEGETAA